jgi:nucleotide-binding universal stress UspA family protein
MRVLLAVDGSECSAAPIREAATRPWPEGTIIRILSVIEWEPIPAFIPGGMPLPPSPESEQARERVGQNAVDDAAMLVNANPAVRVETKVVHGNARASIVDEAREWSADLIMLGSHGRTGLTRLLLGSVAHGVLSHAPCSVEVVRTGPHDQVERSLPNPSV